MKAMTIRSTIVCASLMALCAVFINGSDAIDSGDAVAIWLFDVEPEEVTEDSSANGNNAQVKGSPKWIDGPFGKALELNGAGDCLDCGNSESLNVTGEITVTAWVRETEGAVSQDIIEKWEGQGAYPYVIRIRSTGETYFAVYDGANGANLLIGDIRDDSWHHIAFTKVPGKTIKGYLDGKFVDEEPVGIDPADLSNVESRLFIGSRSGSQDFFEGAIDEVGIFNKALTEDEIKNIMTRGLAVAGLAVNPGGRLIDTWSGIKEVIR